MLNDNRRKGFPAAVVIWWRLFLVAVEEEAVEEEADEGTEEDTEGIGGEVEPVTIAMTAGAILL